jgi:hypothetical protein
MNRPRARLWLIAASLYLLFCAWYTNLGGALTQAEQAHYLSVLQAGGATPQRIAEMGRLMAADTGDQFIMLNVIDMAPNPPAVQGAPEGASADELLGLYMQYMWPALFKRACHPVYVGDAIFDALDISGIEGARHWTRGALMRYRSLRDMLEISTNPAFAGRHEFKLAAMTKTIAFPTAPVFYLSDPRMLLLLLLLALLAIADNLFGRRA